MRAQTQTHTQTPTMKRRALICALLVCLPVCLLGNGRSADALPAIVSRATDSISALLSSGSRGPQIASAVAVTGLQQQQAVVSGAAEQRAAIGTQSVTNQTAPSQVSSSVSTLQAHLSNMQTQAQRQLSQLNGLVLSGANQLANSQLAAHAANLTGVPSSKYNNVLEVLSNVGKAIQQQIMSPNGQIQIVTTQNGLSNGVSGPLGDLVAGNNKKNEYQSIVSNESQQFGGVGVQQPSTLQQQQQQQMLQNLPTSGLNGTTTNNYREQGELLRQEIVRRAGQLQQVVASSMDVLKNNGDLIVRRLLEQLNNRLDQAKSKADKIINEPATNEVAIKALNTINQGLNNVNNIITNIVNRLDISGKDGAATAAAINGATQRVAGATQTLFNSGTAAATAGSLLDPTRFKLNLHQIGQQFSAALNAAQQQRQIQQQQQQQQAQVGLNLAGAGNRSQN